MPGIAEDANRAGTAGPALEQHLLSVLEVRSRHRKREHPVFQAAQQRSGAEPAGQAIGAHREVPPTDQATKRGPGPEREHVAAPHRRPKSGELLEAFKRRVCGQPGGVERSGRRPVQHVRVVPSLDKCLRHAHLGCPEACAPAEHPRGGHPVVGVVVGGNVVLTGVVEVVVAVVGGVTVVVVGGLPQWSAGPLRL